MGVVSETDTCVFIIFVCGVLFIFNEDICCCGGVVVLSMLA